MYTHPSVAFLFSVHLISSTFHTWVGFRFFPMRARVPQHTHSQSQGKRGKGSSRGHFPQEAICTHDDPKRILFGIKGFQNKKAFLMLTRGMLYLSNYFLKKMQSNKTTADVIYWLFDRCDSEGLSVFSCCPRRRGANLC